MWTSSINTSLSSFWRVQSAVYAKFSIVLPDYSLFVATAQNTMHADDPKSTTIVVYDFHNISSEQPKIPICRRGRIVPWHKCGFQSQRWNFTRIGTAYYLGRAALPTTFINCKGNHKTNCSPLLLVQRSTIQHVIDQGLSNLLFSSSVLGRTGSPMSKKK